MLDSALPPQDVAILLTNLQRNLNHGAFKLIVVMDALENRLKDMIMYINQNSRFDVLAVELEYYSLDGRDVLIPRLFGAQANKGMKQSWDEEGFMERARKEVTPSVFETIKKLYKLAQEIGDDVAWGTGSGSASFTAKAIINGKMVTLFGVTSTGAVYTTLFRKVQIPDIAKVKYVSQVKPLGKRTNDSVIIYAKDLEKMDIEQRLRDAFVPLVTVLKLAEKQRGKK